MPFIVVVVDEMADLMMVAGKEIEHDTEIISDGCAQDTFDNGNSKTKCRCYHRNYKS